jgi:hypothetical protein
MTKHNILIIDFFVFIFSVVKKYVFPEIVFKKVVEEEVAA